MSNRFCIARENVITFVGINIPDETDIGLSLWKGTRGRRRRHPRTYATPGDASKALATIAIDDRWRWSIMRERDVTAHRRVR